MRNQYYQNQNQNQNQSIRQSNFQTSFSTMNRGSRVSDTSNSSRKRIFKDPPSKTQNNLIHTQSSKVIPQNIPPNQINQPLNQQSHKPILPLPPRQYTQPTDNFKSNRVSEYAFKQPCNFQRKTMIIPPQNNSKFNQNSSKHKLQALAKLKYLNPLARLDYEDRQFQVYTRISKQTQEQAHKKIKARNQLANFQDDPIDQQKQIDDLIQFKLGKTGKHGFITHFQKQQQSIILDQNREYCRNCETFVLSFQYQSHASSCKFQYSRDKNERNYQLLDKVNRIYKLLLEQQQSKESQILKGYLIDFSSTNDPRALDSMKQNIRSYNYEGQLKTIADRICQLLKVKLTVL